MRKLLPAAIAAVLLATGCEKTQDKPAEAPAPPPAPAQSAAPPPTPTPPLPEPDPAKASMPPTPLPGQANDHSNPDFKGGGKPDPTK